VNAHRSEANRPLAVRYAFDRRLQDAANGEGRNYWYAYVDEILSRLGVCADRVPLAACADPAELARMGVLFLGDFSSADLPPGAAKALAEWVESGGVLIGFATEGLDELFGVSPAGSIPQGEDPFSINGYFNFHPSPITRDCRAPIELCQKLVIVSPVRLTGCAGSEELGRFFAPHPDGSGDGSVARKTESPAVAHRRLGEGHAFYFAFNVAQTMWALHQGRPIDRDYDGDGHLRTSDGCILADNSLKVPYSDALHFLLANMIGRLPVPMVHQVPPRDGDVAPALLFFGGDDECEHGVQVEASDFMAARGLPYHINAMPLNGRFALDAAGRKHIESNGHELALHFNFMDGFEHPGGFTREDVLAQARAFREEFGRDSICSVMHWNRWCGWAEPARWMREAGCLADNSFAGWTSPPLNPVNTLGFAFGSAYPRRIWDDAAHGNAPLDFLELPVMAYELGYLGGQCFPERIREALELATRYHLTFDFFWHPVYIARSDGCRRAIDELVRLIDAMETAPVLMGPDGLTHWWRARAASSVRGATATGAAVTFEARCDCADGFVVKIPTGERPAASCTVDGAPARFETANEFGQHWVFIPLVSGNHSVTVEMQPS